MTIPVGIALWDCGVANTEAAWADTETRGHTIPVKYGFFHGNAGPAIILGTVGIRMG